MTAALPDFAKRMQEQRFHIAQPLKNYLTNDSDKSYYLQK